MELIKENGIKLTGKYATQITTSKHSYEPDPFFCFIDHGSSFAAIMGIADVLCRRFMYTDELVRRMNPTAVK